MTDSILSRIRNTARPTRFRNFTTPEDFRDRTLFDAFADAFTPPEDLPLHIPDTGCMALVRDAQRLREDYKRAFGIETAKIAKLKAKSTI